MGAYLSQPVTDKETADGSTAAFRYGTATMQGWRVNNEDAHVTKPDLLGEGSMAYFAIFDGHGGTEVSRFCALHLHNILMQLPSFKSGDMEAAMKEAFLKLDEMMLDKNFAAELKSLHDASTQGPPAPKAAPRRNPFGLKVAHKASGPQAGSTAVVALMRGTDLWVANAGDARAVLVEGGKGSAITRDHTPALYTEAERVKRAGGFLENGRVNGRLAVSRALGDMEFKAKKRAAPEDQIVTALPDVYSRTLTPDTEFLILACDGIWEVLNDQEASDFVRKWAGEGLPLSSVAAKLCDECLAPTKQFYKGAGLDNMSVIIIGFKQQAVPASRASMPGIQVNRPSSFAQTSEDAALSRSL